MKHRIVVLGAGYAGATAAGRLAKRLHRDDVEIIVVNADPEFVERVRLHQLAAGQDLPARRLDQIFANSGVQVRIAWVTAVDTDSQIVTVTDDNGAQTLGYDTLVYALGSTIADYGVPGVAEHAHNVAGKPAALRLRARLNELGEGAQVLIAGAGLTGIEVAAEIAEARPDLDVAIAARGGVGDWLDEKARRYLLGAFDRLGITIHEGTDIARVDAHGVTTAAGAFIPAEMTVWTAGFTAHPLAQATTLELSDTGRIVVDATQRSVSHPNVYAIGDAAHAIGVGGKALRMGCAVASPMAWLGADAIAARLTGRAVPDAPIGYQSQFISLGRRDGIRQVVTPEDQPTEKVVTGRKGARFKELICSIAAWCVVHPTMLKPSRRRHLVPAAAAENTAPGS
ncbi:NAD(P)/FAD-dependent oxidoreductase [Nocardia huaxiensis]|uniref:NAD(P)/FAD-dependent oxidoreductase n=1 Tax=Nocardia huaxiensis TaxID=2755382 RepID=UPI001E4716AC|nr:FAD-dependent oxidoreductase [Nocardia huaxiensis]UFS96070.1 FAD-dependent oxidoreductase [Nocardia huaxiensis]